MNSRDVNKAIRARIRPLLKEHGFSKFNDRNAWRYVDSRIDVINFQSFNSYMAESLKCTTHSFAVNLGVYWTDIPHWNGDPESVRRGGMKPKEYECMVRGTLLRELNQQELDRHDIWYIDGEGRYLEAALADVASQFLAQGLPWYARLADDEEVLRIFREADVEMPTLFGFGNNPSPIRHYMIGYMAMKLGLSDLASIHLGEILDQSAFQRLHEQIRGDLAETA